MKSKLITLLIFALYLSLAHGQINFIPFQADYASFRGEDGKAFTEIYLSVFQSELTYQDQDSLKQAHFKHIIQISEKDSIIAETERMYKNTMNLNEAVNPLNQFMDVFAFTLKPGTYQMKIGLKDEVSQKSGEYNIDIIIPDFGDKFSISEIELATKAEKAETPSNYSYKNNIAVYPNPSRVYGLLYPVMYYYFEAYNLVPDASGTVNYSFHYYITDTANEMVRDFPKKERKRTTTTIAEATGTNVIALPSGIYKLHIDLYDHNSGDSLGTEVKFAVKKLDKDGKPEPVAGQETDAMLDLYSTYTREQLEEEFAISKYIATSEERNIFSNLDEDGMRRFLADFWKRRDKNPETPFIEYRREYFELVELANVQFSNNFKKGWRTDRGRVILIYGRPDEIERNPSTINTRPYEIWYYYSLDGGSQFVFGDLSGHGEYELLHSTFRNELQDPNWQNRLGGTRF